MCGREGGAVWVGGWGCVGGCLRWCIVLDFNLSICNQLRAHSQLLPYWCSTSYGI